MIGFEMQILRTEIDGQFRPNKQNCKILETCTFLSKTQKWLGPDSNSISVILQEGASCTMWLPSSWPELGKLSAGWKCNLRGLQTDLHGPFAAKPAYIFRQSAVLISKNETSLPPSRRTKDDITKNVACKNSNPWKRASSSDRIKTDQKRMGRSHLDMSRFKHVENAVH